MLNEPKTAVAEWRTSWTLVAAATIGYSLAVVHASLIGVMMGPIERDLGWTRTEIFSGVSLVSFVAMGLATFGVGIAPLGANYVYDLTQSYELVMWAVVPVLVISASLYASLGAYPDFETKTR